MKRIVAAVAIGGCGLILLGAPAIAAAQEASGEQALIERLRQIQGELGRDEAQTQPSARAGELIREIEVIERQLRAASADEGPALSEEEVRSLVGEGLGVDVLKAEAIEREGRQVYAVTVMNPPGNYNGAFMVRTLLIDGATGSLVGEVPRTPRTAATEASRAPAASLDGSGLEIRRRTWR